MPVRRLQRRDHSQWLDLRTRLWPQYPLDYQLSEMTDILCQSRRKAVFVFDCGQGRLGGFLEVTLREPLGDSALPLVGYIEGWYVAPKLRRRGVGRALMIAAQRWTARQGITDLSSCTEIGNLRSIRVHRKLGFEESFRLAHFIMEIPPHLRPRKRK